MKDELSNLLCSEKIKESIEASLNTMAEKENGVLYMIDIDNFSEVYDRMGEGMGEEVLRDTGKRLQSIFGLGTLIGRIGGDEFLVFLSGTIRKKEVLSKAKAICEKLQFTVGQEPLEVTVSVGVYIASGRITFANLYEKVADCLSRAKKKGRKSYYVAEGKIFPDIEEDCAAESPVDFLSLRTLLAYMEEGAALLEVGDKIRVLYASQGFYRMLRREREELALPCDLKEIGILPEEEEAYERELRGKVKKSGVIVHTHRILTGKDNWVWRRVKAVRIARPENNKPIVLEMSIDISEFTKSEHHLRESNERLKIAFGQTPHLLWEVDLDTKTFSAFPTNMQTGEDRVSIDDFPECFFSKGIIHPSSFSTFRRFGTELLEGKAEGNGNFLMRSPESECYGWCSLSYRMIFDKDDAPVKAVGIREKMPDVSGIQSTRFPKRSFPEVVRHNLIARLRVNLTVNTIEELWTNGVDRTVQVAERSYAEIVKEWSSKIYLSMERKEFEKCFQRENLMKSFDEGKRWFSREYRRVEPGGNIRWVMDIANLVCNPYTRDIYLFFCTIDIQQRHEWEKLSVSVERDKETNFYTSQTIKDLAEQLIKDGDSTNCTLTLITTQEISAEDSGLAEQKRSFSLAISFALGADCIVGKYKEDTVIVFFPNTISRFHIKQRLEDAFAYVRTVMTDIPELGEVRFVAGAVTEKREVANYERMILRASYLCELRKNSAVDTIAFPDSEEEWLYIGLRKEVESSTSVLPWEVERPLSREEQKAAFNCIADMFLHVDSVKESVESALREIGVYYRADRVYILKLSEDGQTTDMYSEWFGQGKHSIRHIMSATQVKRIPLLQRCIKEKAPVFVRRKGEARSEEESWNFLIFPMNTGIEGEQFLCVENGRQYSEETALLERIVPYLLEEEKREKKDRSDALGKREKILEEIPNLRSYGDNIASIDSEMYSTMGVLALDVPNFSAINGSYGFPFGQKMLSDIAKVLTDVFGEAFKFRTWDAEFVVLYPDSIQEAFIGRCARVRTILQRSYPGQIRIGDVWSEGVFSGENLVQEAQSMLQNESTEPVSDARLRLAGARRGNVSEKIIKKRSFTAYFQPKIDIRDGSLVGAEALAREIDEDGRINSPAQLVARLEESRKIREMDFYMLEQVLWQMSEWQSRGYPPVKISVNISRVTLLDPNTLASILAIQSHYPEITPDQISLEITETAGDVEKTTLTSIVETFRDFGISFDLDDFGSRYSNMAIFSNVKFDTIKLDKSLIHDLPSNEINRAFVKELVNICKDFGMTCVAEGVENRWQRDALLEAGCIYGQGYYYAKPMPPEKFEQLYLKTLHQDRK